MVRKHSEETKRKISERLKGVKKSKESIIKMVETRKRLMKEGKIKSLKGISFEERYGVHRAKEIKGKLSKNSFWKNKKRTEHSKKLKRKYENGEIKPWNKGLTQETDERVFKNCKKSHETTRLLYGNSDLRKTDLKIMGKKISKSKMGHEVNEITRQKIRTSRMSQILPKKDTSIEVKIQNFLKTLHLEFATHCYMSEIKNSYQCDIFIPKQETKGVIIPQKTIIECDGCYWHYCEKCCAKYSKNIPERIKNSRQRDNQRTKELIEKGFRVIRFWEHEIRKMELEDFEKII